MKPTWLTNIIVVPLFSNVLGILSIFVHAGSAILFASIADHLPRNFPQWVVVIPMLFLIPLAVGAFDVWWRQRQAEPDRWRRLFNPVNGGCIFLIPLWLLNGGLVLSFVVLILFGWLASLV